MDSAALSRVRALFDAASEMHAAERGAFLDARCPDPILRAQVESLLAAHDGSEQFLAMPAALVHELESDGGDPFLGFTLGAYRITGVLGIGGMGAVYRAEQHNPRRTVALKVIRTAWATPALRRRFTHETEALGRLKHPGIAAIFEAGSAPGPDGREVPFFAMELVKGLPLTDHAVRNSLSTSDRLALFAMVCDAVHHAHQKGLVHRDLKPANILVEDEPDSTATGGSTAAGGARPKILDFGIARLTDSDATLTTMHTDPGQIVGTLAYMSPEQVRGETNSIDTRSDVYALGVVLYELLAGKLPYGVKGKPVAQAARIITDDDPTLLGAINRGLRGDVETIVLKCLAKEPERRYQSAAELAADVRRHLGDLPIVARPATTTYQLRKFARRNKALVAGVCTAFVALSAGIVGTSIALVRARDAEALAVKREEKANAEARKARKSVDFLVSMLTGADPDKTEGKEVTVRELLDQASSGVAEELREDPEVHLAAEDAVARTYRAIGVPEKAGMHFDVAEAITRKLLGEGSVEYADLLVQQAHVRQDLHEWRRVIEIGNRALAIFERQLAPGDIRIGKVCGMMAGTHASLNEIPEAERLARRYYDVAVAADSREDIANAAGAMADILQRVGGPTAAAEGERFLRLQVETLIALKGPSHSTVINAKENLGWFLSGEQRLQEAVDLLEEARAGFEALYGQNHRKPLNTWALLARVYQDLGQAGKAEECAAKAVDGFRAIAPGSSDLAVALHRQGLLVYRRKDFAGAERLLRECVEIREKIGDPRLSGTMSQLAGALEYQGKMAASLDMHRRAIEMRRASGNVNSDFGTMLNNYANALGHDKQDELAEKTFRESIETDERLRPGNPLNGYNLRIFANFLAERMRFSDAEPLIRKAWDLAQKQSATDQLRTGTLLATVLDGVGKTDEAALIRSKAEALAPPPPPAAAATSR
ncbi:eukaryotic-like serine/threonine-protein kinase [Phycisphaerales bacterium]|nr:eukaryotic-like serine/threonine-protein kinase [Phycisphaerales bacterium]